MLTFGEFVSFWLPMAAPAEQQRGWARPKERELCRGPGQTSQELGASTGSALGVPVPSPRGQRRGSLEVGLTSRGAHLEVSVRVPLPGQRVRAAPPGRGEGLTSFHA